MDSKRIYGLLLALALTAPAVQAVDTLYDERFRRWTEQAESGDADAQYKLGNAYLRGTEVARDFDAAAEWFEKAAAQAHVKSHYKLGYLYYEGKGVKANYEKAYRHLRRAAQNEYSPAQFYLGKLYADGKGVEQDDTKALYWFSRAAGDNYVPAKSEVEKLKQRIAEAEAEQEAQARAQAEEATKRTQARPVAKKPAVKPAVAVKTAAPQPTAVSEEPEPAPVGTKEQFLSGNWLDQGGEPSKHMPSSLTQCGMDGDAVVCRTERLTRTNLFARVDYMVEARFARFSDDEGEFMGTYRTNVLFVLPDDPDDPNPSEEDIPTTGWKQRTVIKCKFVGEQRLDCVNDNFKRELFSRAEPAAEPASQPLRAGASSQ